MASAESPHLTTADEMDHRPQRFLNVVGRATFAHGLKNYLTQGHDRGCGHEHRFLCTKVHGSIRHGRSQTLFSLLARARMIQSDLQGLYASPVLTIRPVVTTTRRTFSPHSWLAVPNLPLCSHFSHVVLMMRVYGDRLWCAAMPSA